MVEPKVDVKPAEPVNPAPSEPTQNVQPPAEEPAVTPEPEGEPTPEDKVVPLAALHEERDKRQSLQAELDAMKQVAGPNMLFDINGNPVQAAPPTPQGSTQAPNADEFQKNLDKAWEDDPRQAVEMTVGAAIQWRDDVDSEVDDQIHTVSGKHEDFNAYQNDVRKYIRALPLNQRSNPGVAEMAYFVVKGQKSGNVYTKAQTELLDKIKKGEAVTGLTPGTSSTPAVEKGIVLTQEQLNVAAAMGISPEDYKSAIKQ